MTKSKAPAIEALRWRYAVKRFDSSKQISESDKESLLESIILSPSSYGLQPFKVFIIENKGMRNKLQAAAMNQSQITDASLVLVFAAQKSIDKKDIDAYMANITKTRNVDRPAVDGFGNYILSSVEKLSPSEIEHWNKKQCYIALGHLMQTAAELKIDSTPMEGFNPLEVDQLLNLDELNLNSTLICTLGFRHTSDETQHNKKVRKAKEDLFVKI
jgi:nitroreductase